MNRTTMILSVSLLILAPSVAYGDGIGFKEYPRWIQRAVLESWVGLHCPCPYTLAIDGTPCGERSAYSRPGGDIKPLCYAKDIENRLLKCVPPIIPVRSYRKKEPSYEVIEIVVKDGRIVDNPTILGEPPPNKPQNAPSGPSPKPLPRPDYYPYPLNQKVAHCPWNLLYGGTASEPPVLPMYRKRHDSQKQQKIIRRTVIKLRRRK